MVLIALLLLVGGGIAAWYHLWFLRIKGPPLREIEIQELSAFYDRVVPHDFPDLEAVEDLLCAYLDAIDALISEPIIRALDELVEGERFGRPPDFDSLDLVQCVELRQRLRAWERKAFDGQRYVEEFVVSALASLASAMPKTESPSPFTIPLMYAHSGAKEWITRIYFTLYLDKYLDRDLFQNLRTQMYLNLCVASNIDPDKDGKKEKKHARDSDLRLPRIVDTYLRDTPFHALFNVPVPLKMTHDDRFNHMHVLAGSGHGKTTLIENLIRHDLASPDPPSIILIDPHSDLVRKLMRSDLSIEDRLIHIDPRDTKNPVALNPLAVNRERLAKYDEATREQVTAGVIQTFGYLWNGLTNLTLTGKQEVFFRLCNAAVADGS